MILVTTPAPTVRPPSPCSTGEIGAGDTFCLRSTSAGTSLSELDPPAPAHLQACSGEDPFDPASYDALLRIDVKRAEAAFPEVFAPDAPSVLSDAWEDEDE